MKILMTNYNLEEIGGTQTWVATVARELSRDHQVDFLSTRFGQFYEDHLARIGDALTTSDDIQDYDLAIVNHPTVFQHIKAVSGAFTVYNAHGPSHRLEMLVPGADAYTCVSEEIAGQYEMFEPEVVRQPIDLERYAPDPNRAPDGLPRALIACKNATAQNVARGACAKAGYAIDFMHYKNRPWGHPETLMPRFDVVIGSGRTVVEAMACGATPFVFDLRGGELRGDGWVTEENVDELAMKNFSGRSRKHRWSVDTLAAELRACGRRNLRRWVEDNCDVRDVAQRFVEMAERVEA